MLEKGGREKTAKVDDKADEDREREDKARGEKPSKRE